MGSLDKARKSIFLAHQPLSGRYKQVQGGMTCEQDEKHGNKLGEFNLAMELLLINFALILITERINQFYIQIKLQSKMLRNRNSYYIQSILVIIPGSQISDELILASPFLYFIPFRKVIINFIIVVFDCLRMQLIVINYDSPILRKCSGNRTCIRSQG